jgi:thymidylate synthase (FAD)
MQEENVKIIKPYAVILDRPGLAMALQRIESAARVSHRSEDLQTEATTDRFIRAVVLQHGDWSVVEHVSASVEFLVDRGITHEIVRHRIASYTQESTRFVNYAKKMPPSFVYPIVGVECARCLSGDDEVIYRYGDSSGWIHKDDSLCPYNSNWLWAIKTAEDKYRQLLAGSPLETKWIAQDARSVFPNALAAKIIVTMNLRSWRQFFLMRTSKEAHPQMRQVTIPLLGEFQHLVPILYEDIEPGSRQVENIAKGR